jgi:AcrR family transcriptional regulator
VRSVVATAVTQRSGNGHRTRQRIIDASRQLFATRGFESTSVRDIAAACGISDAAIFYHFPEKIDILEALVSGEIELPVSRPADVPKCADSLSARIVDRAMEIFDQNRDLMRIVLGRGLAGDELSRGRYQDWTEFWEGRLAPVIEQTSPMTGDESRQISRQIVLLVFMAVQDRLLLRRDETLTPAERRSDLRDFLVRSTERLLVS